MTEKPKTNKIFKEFNKTINFATRKKSPVIPYYLKNGLPDQRFLDFRLFIHNRKTNEVQHDLKFFDSMFTEKYKKKKSKSFSNYKRKKTTVYRNFYEWKGRNRIIAN